MTELAKKADIVLPAATFLESEGTITGYLGKDKEVRQVIIPAGDSKQHKDICIELSKAMGSAVKAPASAKGSVKAAKPSFSPFEKKAGLDADPAAIMESVNASVVNHSKLLWLKEAQKATA